MTNLELHVTNLDAERDALLAKAREASAQRAARTVYDGPKLRQLMLALLGGAELAEHASPPEATVQVISGRILLRGDGREWELSAGDLLPIPPERHSVRAEEDSVFLLTVRLETGQPKGAGQ